MKSKKRRERGREGGRAYLHASSLYFLDALKLCLLSRPLVVFRFVMDLLLGLKEREGGREGGRKEEV